MLLAAWLPEPMSTPWALFGEPMVTSSWMVGTLPVDQFSGSDQLNPSPLPTNVTAVSSTRLSSRSAIARPIGGNKDFLPRLTVEPWYVRRFKNDMRLPSYWTRLPSYWTLSF